MTVQLSTAVRNGRLDSLETTIGVSAKLQFWTGSMPANCAAASTGTKVLDDSLASDWMANASSGSKIMNGLPIAGSGAATGTAGYFRVTDSPGTTCHIQGTITATGGGGDMTLDSTSISSGQTVNITGFTLTDGNA